MNNWKIDNVEELSEEEQKEYLEKLEKQFADKKASRKKGWEIAFAAGAIGILSGAFLIGLGGEALDIVGTATILTSTLAEGGIAFGAMANISDIEMEAQKQINEVKSRINKAR